MLLVFTFLEVRDHPSIAPHVSDITSLIKTQALSSMRVSNFNELSPQIANLQNSLMPHEATYAISNLETSDQVNVFWELNCKNMDLSHSVLTHHAKLVICDTIGPYVTD